MSIVKEKREVTEYELSKDILMEEIRVVFGNMIGSFLNDVDIVDGDMMPSEEIDFSDIVGETASFIISMIARRQDEEKLYIWEIGEEE